MKRVETIVVAFITSNSRKYFIFCLKFLRNLILEVIANWIITYVLYRNEYLISIELRTIILFDTFYEIRNSSAGVLSHSERINAD